MLLPLPRLTSSLRAPFDVDQAYLHRKSILQSRKSKRSKDDSELSRKLIPRWDEASSDVRQTYKQFLKALVELINGETSSKELHEVAKTIYDFFTGPDTACGDVSHRIADKREELQMLVGHSISDSALQKVASLAQRLFSLQSSDDKTDLIQAKLADGGENCHEFGNNITFQSPTRFLVETPSENGYPLATDSWTAPVSLHEDNDHQQLFSSHESSVSQRTVNLRWLKNVCDQIVEGGNSQLSGDELAMALCRVLQSNKAGDEIAGDLLDFVGDDAFEVVQDLLSHGRI